MVLAGPLEVVGVAGLALLLFGPKLVPWAARKAGGAVAALRHADDDVRDGRTDAQQRDNF